jgi:hypothetical protein
MQGSLSLFLRNRNGAYPKNTEEVDATKECSSGVLRNGKLKGKDSGSILRDIHEEKPGNHISNRLAHSSPRRIASTKPRRNGISSGCIRRSSRLGSYTEDRILLDRGPAIYQRARW